MIIKDKKKRKNLSIWRYKKLLNYKSDMANMEYPEKIKYKKTKNILRKKFLKSLYIIIIIYTYIMDLLAKIFDVKLTKDSFWGLTSLTIYDILVLEKQRRV